MSIGPRREDSADVNERILRWLKLDEWDRPNGIEMAAELAMHLDAFHQRVCRLRKKQKEPKP